MWLDFSDGSKLGLDAPCGLCLVFCHLYALGEKSGMT